MKKKPLSLSQVYKLIEPGPVVMITTLYKDKPNIMSMTWHMMVEFEPPLIACVISDMNYSFKSIKKTQECVINIPTVDLVDKVVGIGETSGAKVDKFKKFDLTPEPSSEIIVPMIGECFANLECIVTDMQMVPKYDIFILEVVKAWIATSKKQQRTLHHAGNGEFIVDGKIIRVPFSKK